MKSAKETFVALWAAAQAGQELINSRTRGELEVLRQEGTCPCASMSFTGTYTVPEGVAIAYSGPEGEGVLVVGEEVYSCLLATYASQRAFVL